MSVVAHNREQAALDGDAPGEGVVLSNLEEALAHDGKPTQQTALDGVVYAGGLVCGLAALARMFAASGEADWSAFAVILLLSAAATRMRLRKGIGTSSPAILIAFAAVLGQPAAVAFLLLAVVQLFERLPRDAEDQLPGTREWSLDLLFALSAQAAAVFASVEIYRSPTLRLPWVFDECLAAALYFFVLAAFAAARTPPAGLPRRWGAWVRGAAWAGPLCLIVPLTSMATLRMLDARSIADVVIGVVAAVVGYRFLGVFQADQPVQMAPTKPSEDRRRALEAFAIAVEAKDGSTAQHLKRVKFLAVWLGRRMQRPEHEVLALELAALLHDVGKVGVPDYILQKPNRLTDAEFQIIAGHAAVGAEIVSALDFPDTVHDAVFCHHEHWDGGGYPRGLKGEEIPVAARILTIVDSFDALVSERPYRRALAVSEAVELMREQRGKIFDPEILDVFIDELPVLIPVMNKQIRPEPSRETTTMDLSPGFRQSWLTEAGGHVRVELSPDAAAMQKLSRRPDHLAAFREVMTKLGADLQYERGFHEVLGILRTVCGADSIALLTYHPETHSLRIEWARGVDPEAQRVVKPTFFGRICERAMAGREIIVSGRTPETALEAQGAFAGVESLLAAPLYHDGTAVGMLLCGSRSEGSFDSEHQLLIELLSDKLASTLAAARQLRKMRIDAHTDVVTALPNARATLLRLDEEIDRAAREGQSLGVLFMDVNGLKPINDCYGHAAGDRLLAEIGARLRTSLRSYDFVGRVGGDEFLALLPGISTEHLEKTIQGLKATVSHNALELRPGAFVRPMISVGGAMCPNDGAEANELLELSDKRMYADKESGRLRDLLPGEAPIPSLRFPKAAKAGPTEQ